MAAQTRTLVSAQWLADAVRNNLIGAKLRVLDTSWYLAKTKRDPKAEFAQKHIPGASFFDIDECSDRTSALDHMLPGPEHFSQYVGGLGIGNNTHVVVYDTSRFGSYCAPRVWWMFRLFGHSRVSVLDGGMKNWLAEGFPTTSDHCKPSCAEFTATFNGARVKSYEDVLENSRTGLVQVVDARSAGRFRGTEPEPREGKRASDATRRLLWSKPAACQVFGFLCFLFLFHVKLMDVYKKGMHFSRAHEHVILNLNIYTVYISKLG